MPASVGLDIGMRQRLRDGSSGRQRLRSLPSIVRAINLETTFEPTDRGEI